MNAAELTVGQSLAPLSALRTRRVAPARLAPNAVIGMVIFVVAEVMFFAGLISAFRIVQTTAAGPWPPVGQPRLPIEATAVNTVALVLSAVVFWWSAREFRRGSRRSVTLCALTLLLGGFFVVFQGVEWVALISEGLTLTSSTHGSFFYLIVGAHGLHVLVALGGVSYVLLKMQSGRLERGTLGAMQVLWTFVVLLWPVLYARVYLS